MWRYRELLWILAVRDIKVRYRQTLIGAAWAAIQPITTMVVFTVLFTLMGSTPSSGDVPYAVTLYTALLPWQLFSISTQQSAESLVANNQLVTKVYMPRVFIPMAPIVAGLIDFLIAFLILLVMMGFAGIVPSIRLLAVPLFVAHAILTSLGLGLWMSSLNALYRDFRLVVPFLLNAGMFVTPVIYETGAVIPARWQSWYALNPMAGVVEGFRWSLLGADFPTFWGASALTTFVLLTSGLLFFRRTERQFADRI